MLCKAATAVGNPWLWLRRRKRCGLTLASGSKGSDAFLLKGMKMILNLTQHAGTPEQGVTEPLDKAAVQRLLTFDALPMTAEIQARAGALADIAARETGQVAEMNRIAWNTETNIPSREFWPAAMIGGAPFFMSALESALEAVWVRPVYAFSVRQAVETVGTDGKSTKTSVFRHVGFVEVK